MTSPNEWGHTHGHCVDVLPPQNYVAKLFTIRKASKRIQGLLRNLPTL